MVTCYFSKLKKKLRAVRERRRRKAMMLKWSTEMKIKRMTLNSSPNQMMTKVRGRKIMKPMKTRMKRKKQEEEEEKGNVL